jgi:bacterioferritin
MANDGARQELIDGLNEDLAHEYAAIIMYLLFSRMVTGIHRPHLSAFLEAEIADELNHAKFLANKVVALGGTPVTQPAEVKLTQDSREMIEMALAAEVDTIERYTRRIKQAEAAAELGLKVELENLVSEETTHKEDMERVLSGWPS